MTNTTATQTIIRHPAVLQAYARRGMVGALHVGRVILAADADWSAQRAEDSAAGGYSREAYMDAAEAATIAHERYLQALRTADAALHAGGEFRAH